MVKIEKAATILVGRDHPIQGLQILLLLRNRNLNFASDTWVFPGGKIDNSELDTYDDLSAAVIAACREAKEESSLTILPDDINYFCKWTTPEGSPRRFETFFFCGVIPYHDSEVTVDGGEIHDYKWVTPKEAIEASTSALRMMPPTFITLVRISKAKNWLDAEAELTKHEPLDILPVVVKKENVFISLYKGDCGYNSKQVDEEGPRHRMIFDVANSTSEYIYENCESYRPITGGNHK